MVSTSSSRSRKLLEALPGHVRDVPAGDDDVADAGRGLEVVDHRVVAVDRLAGQLELGDLRGRVADEVHPGAVPAVLWAGREQLGQDLGGVAVGEPLGGPHVVLVEAVTGGERVRRPVGAPVGEDREHVPPHRVGAEGLGEGRPGRRRVAVGAGTMVLSIWGVTSIDIVARSAWSRSRSA